MSLFKHKPENPVKEENGNRKEQEQLEQRLRLLEMQLAVLNRQYK